MNIVLKISYVVGQNQAGLEAHICVQKKLWLQRHILDYRKQMSYHTEISIRVGIAQDWHGSSITLNAVPWAISKGSDSILNTFAPCKLRSI